tara:strand:- start:1066 stop:2166 length:1101 start_codon:yes stop_codon:yes gene_type:complete
MVKGANNKFNYLDFIDLLSKLYSKRKIILKYTLYSIILGITISILTPNRYTSETIFVPQVSSKNFTGNNLSGLASIAGINLSSDNKNSEISPLLYPKILESSPFKLELLNSKIFYNDESITLRDFILNYNSFNFFHLLRKYTIGLPSLILSLFNTNDVETNITGTEEIIYYVNNEDAKLFKIISQLLQIKLNEKEKIVALSSTHTEKTIPAQITKNATIILQNRIIEFKSRFSREILEFTLEQYDLKKNELNLLQDRIGKFKDQNININSSLYQNTLDRLQSQALILQNVVQQLASQVEEAKLQVNKDTPIFTLIQPVNIPNQKSYPSRSIIVILFAFLGFLFTSFLIIYKKSFTAIIQRIKMNNG